VVKKGDDAGEMSSGSCKWRSAVQVAAKKQVGQSQLQVSAVTVLGGDGKNGREERR